MALQEDDDTTGDVISVNGTATETLDDDTQPAEKEDRGDVVTTDDEATDEESAAPAKAEPETESHKPQTIPKVRFDEVNNRKNELAAELAEAQRRIEELTRGSAPKAAAAEAPAAAFDADAKEKEYIEALLDGDTDLAMSIRKEINSRLVEQATERVEMKTRQQQLATELETVSAQAVADYPYLDTEEGREALELIVASRDSRIARGMSPAAALREAVAAIAPRFSPDANNTPRRELTGTTAKTDTRTTEAVMRGAKSSTLQPPAVQLGVGDRNAQGRVNVSEMSEEQFENLSTAEKKRLRGDQ